MKNIISPMRELTKIMRSDQNQDNNFDLGKQAKELESKAGMYKKPLSFINVTTP